MDGVYETSNTATVDLVKVGKVTINDAGASCGGFGEFKTPGGTFPVSEPNTKALNAWAEAPKKGNMRRGIDTSRIKVYLRKNASDNPKIDVMSAIAMGYSLAALYKGGGEGGTPLDPKLNEEIAQGVGLLINASDVKPRLEKAIGADIDIKGTSDKSAAKEYFKFMSLQRPVSYYQNKTSVSYVPDISATLTPSYWGSWNDDNGKIQFKINGESFCKSSLMIINTNSDFGYWYNAVVGGGDIPAVNLDDLQAKWNSFTSAKLEPFTAFAVDSLNGNIPLSTVFRAASNGVSIEYQADFDSRSYGSFSLTYILGNPFGDNAVVSPYLPDGVEVRFPAGLVGKAFAGAVRPIINNILTEVAGGAGQTQNVFQGGIDGIRGAVVTPIVNAITNLLMDTSPESSTDTLNKTREGLNGPETQNDMGEERAVDSRL